MHRGTHQPALPALTADLLREHGLLVDNVFAVLWRRVGMDTRLNRAGFEKRSGTPAPRLVFSLMLWVWLKVGAIGGFARESLPVFCAAEKDALYGMMNREDWDWRRLHQALALKAVRTPRSSDGPKALVLDDSIKTRHGKKMPGVSSPFDHPSGRHVMGQQVLTLGLSGENGFVPLDSELFVSSAKARGLRQPFKDGRRIVAKRYRVAVGQAKPPMARAMVRRAARAADYLLADAWFGHRPTIRMADVELDPRESPKAAERWIKVRLLFVRGIAEGEKARAGKHDWAVFLSTDPGLGPQRILERYALRWAMEVYFKEAQQHLGFLKEPSNHYAAYVASIHLAAVRCCRLAIAKAAQPAGGVADIRKMISANAQQISLATQLWQVFRAVIAGALDELKALPGDAATLVMETIDSHMQGFFVQALRLDPRTLRLEAT
jgi:hypothetical protein